MATGRVPTTANSPLTAKGDLFGYSTTQARVAVGNDGETLVADSSTSTGLRYTGNYAAGKNVIINGDFRINQRNFTTTSSNSIYGFDRWRSVFSGGTYTYSAQTFTPGTAPVAGYEGTNFARITTSGQSGTSDYASFAQSIEDVRTDAGQTITLSFWAKASSGTPSVAAAFEQRFGSGGSPSSNVVTHINKAAVTTSWARYSMTIAVPSLTGKTIGTTANTSDITLYLFTSGGSALNSYVNGLGIQNTTIDFWGVQIEAGSVATAFQTATGTIQGELAACQRYYTRWTATSTNTYVGAGNAYSTTVGAPLISFPVEMRVAPTSLDNSGVFLTDDATNYSGGTTTLAAASTKNANIRYVHGSAALTALRFYYLSLTATTGYLGLSAEL